MQQKFMVTILSALVTLTFASGAFAEDTATNEVQPAQMEAAPAAPSTKSNVGTETKASSHKAAAKYFTKKKKGKKGKKKKKKHSAL